MIRARALVATIAFVVGLCFIGDAQFAQAQTYPPGTRLYTIPASVFSNQPFTLVVEAMAPAAAIGIWHIDFDEDAGLMEIFFDDGCGFICPGDGTPYLRTFEIEMAGLAEGNYLFRLPGDPPVELPLAIVGAPVSLPFANRFTLSLLATLIFAVAFQRLRHIPDGSTAHHG